MLSKYYAFILLLLLAKQSSYGQENFDWWNKKHQWDGNSHWTTYMRYSAGYMGPNALPVPQMHDGLLNPQIYVESGAGFHLQPGEFTADGIYRIYFPFAKGATALEINHTPIEYYKTDTVLRDLRRARSRNVEGFATSDINVATYFTLLRHTRWPDIVIRINLRTASGTRLADARNTDAPGYFFDITAGKTLKNKNGAKTTSCQWRLYSMLGFYSWQTTYATNRQNDALLFGAGTQLKTGKHNVRTEVAGYLGYMQERDDPVVARIIYQYGNQKRLLHLKYQKGLNDIAHHAVHVSLIYIIQPRTVQNNTGF